LRRTNRCQHKEGLHQQGLTAFGSPKVIPPNAGGAGAPNWTPHEKLVSAGGRAMPAAFGRPEGLKPPNADGAPNWKPPDVNTEPVGPANAGGDAKADASGAGAPNWKPPDVNAEIPIDVEPAKTAPTAS
jgi:hypothetical protein